MINFIQRVSIEFIFLPILSMLDFYGESWITAHTLVGNDFRSPELNSQHPLIVAEAGKNQKVSFHTF